MGIGSTSGLAHGGNDFHLSFIFSDDYSSVSEATLRYTTTDYFFKSTAGSVKVSTSTIPIPPAVLLMGSGLVSLLGLKGRLKK